MTISTLERKTGLLEGNAVTTTFPFTWSVVSAETVKVMHVGSTGIETPLTKDVDYTVTLNEETPGGEVEYPVSGDPLPVGEKLVIYRESDLTQLMDLQTQGTWSPDAVEDAFDHAILIAQEQDELLSRSLKVSIADTLDPTSLYNNLTQASANAAADAAAASTSESNAATSEGNAATSASSAATSETNAATSETNAAASGASATASAAAAAISASNAVASETNASTSASNAEDAETAASMSADASASSAATALGHAQDAADSATTVQLYGTTIHVGPTPPASPAPGVLWLKDDVPALLIYNTDSVWVDHSVGGHGGDVSALLDVVYTQAVSDATFATIESVDGKSDANHDHLTVHYTKAEVDNAIAGVINSISWKPSVATYAAIATTYPTPEEGWTVAVDDTNEVYRYDSATSTWLAISAQSVPMASPTVDGKMAKELYSKLIAIESGATADMTPTELLAAVKTVDGSGSGLDADTLDGYQASDLALSSHSHSVASTTTNGMMSAADKSKLNTVATGANNYSLPVATSAAIGGVLSGGDVAVNGSGQMTVQNYSHNHDTQYSSISHGHAGVYAAYSHDHDSVYSLLSHSHTLNQLSNVSTTGISTGQGIVWNGSSFVPGDVGGGSGAYVPLAGGVMTGNLQINFSGEQALTGSSLLALETNRAIRVTNNYNHSVSASDIANKNCISVQSDTPNTAEDPNNSRVSIYSQVRAFGANHGSAIRADLINYSTDGNGCTGVYARASSASTSAAWGAALHGETRHGGGTSICGSFEAASYSASGSLYGVVINQSTGGAESIHPQTGQVKSKPSTCTAMFVTGTSSSPTYQWTKGIEFNPGSIINNGHALKVPTDNNGKGNYITLESTGGVKFRYEPYDGKPARIQFYNGATPIGYIALNGSDTQIN